MKYTFSEFIENKIVNEVAEYMTGDDANIEFEESSGSYTANHKKLGRILLFQHDLGGDSRDMLQDSSPTQRFNFSGDVRLKNKGYNVIIPKTFMQHPWKKSTSHVSDDGSDNIQDKMNVSAGSNKQSEFLGSHLSAIAKFIKTYSPGTLNFEDMFRQLNTEMPDLVPLMQKSLDMIARKNKLVLLNNKIMNKDALGSANRRGGHTIDPVTGDVKAPTKYTGLESEKRNQEKIDKTVQGIKSNRDQGRALRQSSIQQTNDFMNQYNSKKR
jgi:hypothetical protein